jgi:hypothetical protein
MYIGYGNSNSGLTRIYGGGATSGELTKFATYTEEVNSFRAPIFYDSNNSAFYIDPSNTTTSGNLAAELIVGQNNNSTGGGINFSAAGSAYIRGRNQDGASSTLSNLHLQSWFGIGFGPSISGQTVPQGQNAAWIDCREGDFTARRIITANQDMRSPTFYDSNDTSYFVNPNGTSTMAAITLNSTGTERQILWTFTGRNVYFFGRDSDDLVGLFDSVGSFSRFYTTTSGEMYVYSDLFAGSSSRAPIFYDSNNTAFYTDPAGTSLLNGLTVGTGGSSSITMVDSDEGNRILHCNSNRIGFLTQAGAWGSWCTDDGTWQTDVSVWAPIFYDQNNTAFYIDSNNTSSLNGLQMNSLIIGASSASTDVNTANDSGSLSVRGSGSTVAAISFHRTGAYAINMGVGTDNVFRIGGWSASSNCLQLDSAGRLTLLTDVRAPIYYDSNNTAFYADPASTSNFTNLTVTGTLSATVSVDFNNLTNKASGSGTYTTSGDFRAPIFYDSNNTAYYLDPAASGTALNINGGITFAQANPNIIASSYFVAPGGAYFNSGIVYFQSVLYARGGIGNDAATALTLSAGHTVINGSARSPIFYDQDNTGWYVDGNNTSNMNAIIAASITSANGTAGLFVSGNTVALLRQTGGSGAYMDYNTGSGASFIHMRNGSGFGSFIQVDGSQNVSIGGTIHAPITDNTCTLGVAYARWSAVFAVNGTINTSDKREKNHIEYISPSMALDFVDNVNPAFFRWKVGGIDRQVVKEGYLDEEGNAVETIYEEVPIPGKRIHAGFYAQDVKAEMDKVGFDWGAWGLDDVNDPDSRQNMRPDQMIPILWAAVKQLKEEVARLQEKVSAQ